MIIVKGSREYMAKVFNCWKRVDSQIGLLEGSVIVSEGDSLRFDARVGMDKAAGYLIMTDNPERIGLLVKFLKIQDEVKAKYFDRVKTVLKVHVSQVQGLFKDWRLPSELAEGYTVYMNEFISFAVSSVFKELALSTNEALRTELEAINSAVNPLKGDLGEFSRSTLYKVLMDNVWRRCLGFKLPEFPSGLDPDIGEVEAVFDAMLDAVKKFDFKSIRAAAEALTSLSLRITNLTSAKAAKEDEQPALYI